MTPSIRHRRLVFVAGTLAVAGAIALACSSGDDPGTPPPLDTTTSGDARPRADAGSDATAAADAPSGPFCQSIDASAVVLCDDFESVTAPLYGFDTRFVDTDAGSLGISAEGGADHPSNVLDVMLAQDIDAGRSAFLTKNLPGTAAPSSFQHYQVEMDVRVVGTASLPYVALSVIGFPAAAIKEHGFAVYDGNVFGRLAPKDFAVKDDKSLWHHARIFVTRDPDAGPSSYATTIDVDGTLIDNVGGVAVGTTGTPTVCVGAFETSRADQGSIRAQFDNVVVRRW